MLRKDNARRCRKCVLRTSKSLELDVRFSGAAEEKRGIARRKKEKRDTVKKKRIWVKIINSPGCFSLLNDEKREKIDPGEQPGSPNTTVEIVRISVLTHEGEEEKTHTERDTTRVEKNEGM